MADTLYTYAHPKLITRNSIDDCTTGAFKSRKRFECHVSLYVPVHQKRVVVIPGHELISIDPMRMR